VTIFADRVDAGRQLAEALAEWRNEDAVVLGIPRGGVVVAAEVARALGLPLGVAIVRKLGAAGHEEFAVGAIAPGVRIVDDSAVRSSHMTPEQLEFVEDRESVELARRANLFGTPDATVEGRVAIIVDDGIATGASATAACRSVRAQGAERIVLATPVAPASWRPEPGSADEYVCPNPIADFWAVGQFYRDFTQTSDEEVARLLARDLPDA
jgi:putative phosphoribosyl transferase